MENEPFVSILYPDAESRALPLQTEEPAFFRDLHLSELISRIAKIRNGADLSAWYYTMSADPEVIRYRQDILGDLEDPAFNKAVSDFTRQVFRVRQFLKSFHEEHYRPESLSGHPLAQGKFLNNAVSYCRAIDEMVRFFAEVPPRSEGFRRFSVFLRSYTETEQYRRFSGITASIREAMDEVDYCLLIRGNTIRVDKYAGQEDYSASITKLFEKFRQGNVKDYRHRLNSGPYNDETEEGILSLLAGLYPREFKKLDTFCREWFDFDEPLLLDFSNEVQFYLRWLEFIQPLQDCRLHFCHPVIRTDKGHLSSAGGFDLALAAQIFDRTVTNDFDLDAPERLIIITGPNQGGKTTFTRAFGQMHYLATLGLSVPGKRAELFLCEKILTHFEREEDLSSENGKLRDDLIRLKSLLDRADEKSLVLINEIFSSTTTEDALKLGNLMMRDLVRSGSFGIIVTFLDELASFSPETVSMMSLVTEDDSRTRTFKIRRKAPDGLAYAMQIAARHGLTEAQLTGRLKT